MFASWKKMNKAILLSENRKQIYTGMKESPVKAIWNCTENLQKNICIPSIKRHPRSIGKCLAEGEGAFKLLDIEQQVKILCDIVQYTSFQRGLLIEGSWRTQRGRKNPNIRKYDRGKRM